MAPFSASPDASSAGSSTSIASAAGRFFPAARLGLGAGGGGAATALEDRREERRAPVDASAASGAAGGFESAVVPSAVAGTAVAAAALRGMFAGLRRFRLADQGRLVWLDKGICETK